MRDFSIHIHTIDFSEILDQGKCSKILSFCDIQGLEEMLSRHSLFCRSPDSDVVWMQFINAFAL